MSTPMGEDRSCPNPGQLYAAGFLLGPQDQVALVRKLRPTWQAGKLNGVGGKIEAGETPAEAMRREFREEAGLDLEGWECFLRLDLPSGAVWFFRLRVPADVFGFLQAGTDERIEVHQVHTLLALGAPTIPNLRWILPLAAHSHDRYAPCVVAES